MNYEGAIGCYRHFIPDRRNTGHRFLDSGNAAYFLGLIVHSRRCSRKQSGAHAIQILEGH